MTDSVFDEMKEVLALQKKAHIDEGPASYELRLDRLNRLSQMLKKYSDEIVDTISEDYGTCLLYTSPSPRDCDRSRMPSSA